MHLKYFRGVASFKLTRKVAQLSRQIGHRITDGTLHFRKQARNADKEDINAYLLVKNRTQERRIRLVAQINSFTEHEPGGFFCPKF